MTIEADPWAVLEVVELHDPLGWPLLYSPSPWVSWERVQELAEELALGRSGPT